MSSKITCDKCGKELEHIFAGDEYLGEFCCMDCLRKSEYWFFHELRVYKTAEFTFKVGTDLELTEMYKKDQETTLFCGVCKEMFYRVENLEQFILEHLKSHKDIQFSEWAKKKFDIK